MTPIIIKIITLLLAVFTFQADFLTDQKKYERVRTSIEDKEKGIIDKLKSNGLQLDKLNILLVAFKAEGKLDIYAKQKSETTYKKLLTYDVCARSGQVGPKRKEGDNQVPEGFYYIEKYNPVSNYLLSLGLNYPNQSDRKKSQAAHLGGDIFIHGSCVTIGCLPMTDDKIKEIYLYAIHARNNGQLKIPVYIFPFSMSDQNFKTYQVKYKTKPELIDFWKNLKVGYDQFEKSRKELNIIVDSSGDYKF